MRAELKSAWPVAALAVFFILGFSGLSAAEDLRLEVIVSQQKMILFEGGRPVREYAVSTSSYGVGNRLSSNKTPLGRHRIAKKIGEGAPLGAIFKSRVFTGKASAINLSDRPGLEDRVTTRILWLEGLEKGVNRGGRVDSFRRCIYIHGTPDEGLIGRPASHGCIRMKNREVIELFDRVPLGTPVLIRR